MAKDLTTPKLSVVMSVYNGEDYVADAVRSILAQTYKDFELIIINDGSTDRTKKILNSFKDIRLRIFEQSNRGLVYSLNRGVKLAHAPLIARHDADDRSKPTRFAKQIRLFESNPNLVLAGTSIQIMDTNGAYLHDHLVLLGNPELKQELLVRSPFAHGSVIFKKEAFEKAGAYQHDEWPAEDYGLWIRMAALGDFANLDEPLYMYRENQGGISSTNSSKQKELTKDLRRKAWVERNHLLQKKIQTKQYLARDMGHFRLERITKNLLFVIAEAVRAKDIRTMIRTPWLLLNDSLLRRKCARLLLRRLRGNYA